ncbi:sugar phosphate exchanger 3 [Caerostris extrusa]|uniref:Sugar phosphate exchanger 3 n=1 Tax=Caerostris extrusa TaxID=172846 RepID=A0AAV4X7N0_CAEEX|nr:sugar phosphate exchanger 3 [Caerostris extrusa]
MTSRRSILRSDRDIEEQSESEESPKREDPSVTKKQWTKYHILAFLLTFFSYALFHATRKTFSNVKVTISATWTPQNTSLPDVFDDNWNGHQLFDSPSDTSVFLGLLDTVFMVAYATGLFISGAIGDRMNLRYVLAFGMCSSSITVFMFGVVSEWLHVYNKVWYILFWSLTGLLQSTGWPTVVAVIGNWFGKSSRGLIMGVWGASPSIGNIVGTSIVNVVLHFGYQYSFLVTSSVTFAFGIVILFSLIPSPRDVGLPLPDESYPTPARSSLSPDQQPLLTNDMPSIESTTSVRPTAVGLCHACCLPGVMAYSFAYACLKFVNYSFFFWLPYYLQMAYGWEEDKADLLSMWGVFIGYLSDKLPSRSPVVGLMLALSPICLYAYSGRGSANLVTNAFLMTLTGTVIGGVASLISTAVSADLGRHPDLSNSKEALSTVTGIIDGTGSYGAAIGQILVPIIMKNFGWKSVFFVFMLMTILTLVCIFKIVYKDTVDLCKILYRRLFIVDVDDRRIND